MDNFRRKRGKREPAFFRPIRQFLNTPIKYVIIASGLIIFLLKFKDIFILLFLGALIMLVDYFLHRFRFPVHIDLLFFVSILIVRAYGFKTSLIFCLVAGNLAELLTGGFEVSDMISIIPIIFLGYLSLFFSNYSIVVVGILFSFLFAILEFFIASMLNLLPHKRYIEPMVVLFFNIILFINLGEFFVRIMSL
ncbi:hypothetical protein JW930_04500 [Candidatus Woesearchaeota archaeon]|nr:hypothetical protein [Candidatus Woesearchaeota archaeon]